MDKSVLQAIKQISTEGKCRIKEKDIFVRELVANDVCDILNGLQVAYNVFELSPIELLLEIELDEHNNIVRGDNQ